MKIVIDARESGTSTGRYVDKLVENLQALKPNFEIVLLAKSHRHEYLRSVAPAFQVVDCNYKEFSFGEQYGLAWQLYGLRADLFHATTVHQPVLYFGPVITTMHDLTTARFRNPSKNRLVFKLKQLIYRWVIKRVARKSVRVIAISGFTKNDVAGYAGIAKDKIVVTYEAADKISEPVEPVLELDGQQFILYVGRPLPHKNLDRLVEAFLLVKQTHPDLRLALVGKRDILYERLEKKVKKQGIGGIVFTGFVSEGQLRWLYENTAAYVFPSLSEGFGLPGLEAMIHGAPVVSSNATCLPEIYGGAAHYFDPNDIQDIAAKITEVLSDERLREDLIRKGYSQIKKYSWAKMAAQTLEIYNQVLKKK
ncbi:MAG: glycosyltransferase family 1 protein [Candidatus Saccharimonadales bacterium]|jgi:glycosyltransferase involved in cell wall biosynthesis